MLAQNPFLAPPKGGISPFHSEPGPSNDKMSPTSPPVFSSKGKSMAKEISTPASSIGQESGIEGGKWCQKRGQRNFGTVQRKLLPEGDNNEAAALWKRRPRRRMPPRGKFNGGTTFFFMPKFAAPLFGLLLLLMAHFAEGNALDGTMAALNGTQGEDSIERLLSSQFPAKNDLKKNNGPSEGPLASFQNKSAKNELDNLARELAAAEEAELEEGANNGTRSGGIWGHHGQGGQRHFQLVSLNWAHVQAPFSLSLWLLLASIAKILFNLDRRVPEAVPDSALLIGLGLVLGAVLNLLGVDSSLFTLPSSTFFLYLLPPIIFDAGYFMPNRQLFENLDSVLLFAFCGTIWNTLAIGFSLLWLAQLCPFPVPFSAFQILLFASLISAVDPVAVIAVFEEIHINEFLFINVFGEALLNDGVSVVLYQMFRKFIQIGEQNLVPLDYVAGIGSFLVIALGGVLIGLLFAVMASLATKYTTRVRILAPVFIFVIPYMAYLSAELFGLSSILAIVACGIGMKQYVKGNLSHDACSSVKYFVKMLAQSSETVIFMFLGLSTMTHAHHWDWLFVGATIAFCLLHRVIGVVVQCAILNRFRTKKFSFSDQFVLSYGGLRGAIAFGLVVSLDDDLPVKNLFVTTCIAVIFFTVFVQGITIRPLLYWLKVEKQDIDHEEKMIEKIYTRYCDYMMAGLEDIAGQKGKNSVRDGFERFNAKILKPVLMRDEQRRTFDTSSIVRAYRKITLIEAHQLARASIRKVKKRSKGGRRVGPAHSPSSFSSTLNSSNCWTTSTTIIMEGAQSNNEEGGMEESRPNSPLSSNGKVKIGEENGEGGHFGEEIGGNGLAPGSENSGEEERVNAAELEQYFAQPDNAEMLYTMFSRLLDRKMAELRMNRKGRMEAKAETGDANANDGDDGERGNEEEEEDDIQDNYLDAFGVEKRRRRRKEAADSGGGAINAAAGTHASQNAAILWPSVGIVDNGQRGWQQRRGGSGGGGDERRRMSLSPAIERQIGANANEEQHSNRQGMAAARRLFLAQKPSLPNPNNGSSGKSTNARGNEENEEWRQREWRRNVP